MLYDLSEKEEIISENQNEFMVNRHTSSNIRLVLDLEFELIK